MPHQFLYIAESMISFKGHLSFLQYLLKNPHKWGMKAWVLADSVNGYTWEWRLYTGREEGEREVGLANCWCVSLTDRWNGGRGCFFTCLTSLWWTAISCSKRPQGLGCRSLNSGWKWLEVWLRSTRDPTTVNATPPHQNFHYGSQRGLSRSQCLMAEELTVSFVVTGGQGSDTQQGKVQVVPYTLVPIHLFLRNIIHWQIISHD